VCNFIWEKKHTRANDAKYVSDNHDFVLFYAKSIEHLKVNRLARSDEANARFTNPDNDARGPWISQPLQVKTPSEKYIYEIVTPFGRAISPPQGRSWAFGPERYRELVAERRIYFGEDGKNVPRLKKFLTEVGDLVPLTIWPREEVGDNQEAKTELKDTVRIGLSFDSPKPVRLVQRVIEIAASSDSLILDSFAGSGTTGHAVLQQNRTDGGNRRFILVEMESKIARDITAERVKRVVQGYTNAKGEKVEGLGGGFRFCELGEPLFDERGQIKPSVRFADLARHVYFTETGEPLPRERVTKSAFIGECRGVGIYLLYNGILGDKTANGGNVLTRAVLAQLPPFNGPKVIYCAGCLLGRDRLQAERITVRQTPYEIKVA
jgi:site-specific DNA-methyltransferase (adenine-specific)/adenine-specific DNA-methyltransferase